MRLTNPPLTGARTEPASHYWHRQRQKPRAVYTAQLRAEHECVFCGKHTLHKIQEFWVCPQCLLIHSLEYITLTLNHIRREQKLEAKK